MATATAPAAAPPTLEGYSGEFQYLKEEERSQLAAEAEVSPHDILAQLNAAEQKTTSVMTPATSQQTPTKENKTEASDDVDEDADADDIMSQLIAAEQNATSVLSAGDPPTTADSEDILAELNAAEQNNTTSVMTPATSEQTPTKDNKTLEPPSAPMKQKEEFQFYDDAESVEISRLIPNDEAPPSPIPFIPEDHIVVDEGPIEEPFDCMPVDDSEEGILKSLERVVQDSDRVLHPNQYDGKRLKNKKEISQQEMALMTPLRSGDPMKSPSTSDCGNSTVTGGTSLSRASVKILGKNKRPQQPVMKLRVNDFQFEPLEKVTNEVEDLPFDETTSHNFKTAIRNIYTTTKAAVASATNTPDTTMMEDTDTDDDTTLDGEDNEDEWTADTSRYTTDSRYTDASDEDTTFDGTEETPMDEAPTKKSAKARRRQKLLAKSRALEKRNKEEMGWDEKLLDAVFSPDVVETGLEMADFLQSSAEATATMTKGILKDAVTSLEKEERALNGEEDEDDNTDSGEGAYRSIAAAATGSNLYDHEDDGTMTENDTRTLDTKEDTTLNGDGVKDPWDGTDKSFEKTETDPNFTDLLSKGLPLVNRKLERLVNGWTRSGNDSVKTNDAVVQDQVTAEDRVSVEAATATGGASTGASTGATTGQEPQGTVPVEDPVEESATQPEVAYKQPQAEPEGNQKEQEEGSSVMAQLEFEDPQAAEEASTGDSLLSLEKPTKQLSV
ncbi:MAG: hypothetical protein SGBAC_007705 [Bacillariaceae sp.]